MRNIEFILKGKVTDPENSPLPGLTVRAYDKDVSSKNALGQPVVTDKKGFYRITYMNKDFRRWWLWPVWWSIWRLYMIIFTKKDPNCIGKGVGGADIIICVYDGNRLIAETKPKMNACREETIDVIVKVKHDYMTFNITGIVKDNMAHPVPCLNVQAFQRFLSNEESLGTGQTDEEGKYSISFEAALSHKSGMAMLIKVFNSQGEELHKSEVFHNVKQDAVIDILLPFLYPGLSEFERLVRSLESFQDDRLIPENLELDEISFMAGETQWDIQKIACLSLAARLTNDSDIQPEFWYGLLDSGFYKVSDNLTLDEQYKIICTMLPSLDNAMLRKGIAGALKENIIPTVTDEQLENLLLKFRKYATRQLIESKDEKTVPLVKQILKEAGITKGTTQMRFAELYQEHGFSRDLFNALRKEESFKASEIADIETSFRLAEITMGDFSVVKAIKNGFDLRNPEAVYSLAKASEEELIDIVDKNMESGALKPPYPISQPEGVELKQAEIYGKQLAYQFQQAFPTAAFSGKLERALQNNRSTALKHAEKLVSLLNADPGLEILTTPIEDYFDTGENPMLDEFREDEDFKLELKAVQRVFKLALDYNAVNTLLEDNLHSSQQIYRKGEEEFVREYRNRPGFDEKKARQTWNRAADTHAAIITLISEVTDFEHADAVSALRQDNEALSAFPRWNNLFSTGDLCECKPCQSVLSPAAYFADLLMFLKYRKAKNHAFTLKDILLKRRPDLGYIELNCENALRSLPYIDVVCEVLEEAVAGMENDLELSGLTGTIPTDMSSARTVVSTAFEDIGITLEPDFSLTRIASTDSWFLRQAEVTWLLLKKGTPHYFARILRNTKASTEEMRAIPQYVNMHAYAKLKTSVYPFILPFDLFNAQMQAMLSKAGLKRWQLMQEFQGTSSPNNPSESDIASEYFGISVDNNAAIDEKRIITQSNPANQYEFWGEPDNSTMISRLTKVNIFLKKTGLEYNQLLTLLDLKFTNPGGSMGIVHLDSCCDTDQKEILGIDEDKLDRIHRFLRLWRKLDDWEMWELDMVIRHPGIGNGDLNEVFLSRLMHLAEVKRMLGRVCIEELCSLMGNLNTETRFAGPHEKRVDALYQNLFLNNKLIHPLDTAFEVVKVDVSHSTETITGHKSIIAAALGLKEADLAVYRHLPRTDGSSYISDELILENLSFLYRHSWLAKRLKFKAEEWRTLLKLLKPDAAVFVDPGDIRDFLEQVAALRQTGFSLDQLNWIFSADRQAKAAVKEQAASRFLLSLRRELQNIAVEYDTDTYPILEPTSPAGTGQLSALFEKLLQELNRDGQSIISILDGSVSVTAPVQGLPAGFDFPQPIKDTIPIRYDEPNQMLRFTGLISDAEKTSLLAVDHSPSYQAAINELYMQPRLALKFYEPVFTVSLNKLPAAIDFKNRLPASLQVKVAFDPESLTLCFIGIMTPEEKSLLEGLSGDLGYRKAVDDLFNQPRNGFFTQAELWIQDTDLILPLHDPADPMQDNLASNLKTACCKALDYLKAMNSENMLIDQLAANLGLTPAMAGKIINTYQLAQTHTVKHYFLNTFVNSAGEITYSDHKDTIDIYLWLCRVAMIITKWKMKLPDIEWLHTYYNPTQAIDFESLPLDAQGAVLPMENFIRTYNLLHLQNRLDQSGITFSKVIENLSSNNYPARTDFSKDISLLTGWNTDDVNELIESLDLNYPHDYLLAENWHRLERAAGFLDKLGAGTDTVKRLANPTVGEDEVKILEQLLRAKYGAESFLAFMTDMQDLLRERKRDALVAWLLAQPQPADAPSGKWENTNDVYAYYLLDVEMGSCMLTSRLVQGSGSIQLFVQRCMMGLEPEVMIKADGDDGDSAWHWWKWMRKYRVWEANRKVFLYPENWIEPELRRDKSSFFKDLENELMQNEVNQYTVETAFLNYLDKLDDVAQLEIAGFYHEDDADRTIIHVFGRTKGAEPHIYYYRTFDYRGWTPWERINLDISGDYLVPAVINKRLFLFWPVFTEVPDEEENKKDVPIPADDPAFAKIPETCKRLKLQMAVSELRNGKWMPKKVSTDAAISGKYSGEIIKKHYKFWPVDRGEIDGRFIITYSGCSRTGEKEVAKLTGSFEIFGCRGVPEKTNFSQGFRHLLIPQQVEEKPVFMKYLELKDNPGDNLSFSSVNLFNLFPGIDLRFINLSIPLLYQTPGIFKIAMPWHPSFIDKFYMKAYKLHISMSGFTMLPMTNIGSWMPFFYEDQHRTFFTLPASVSQENIYYYPDIKREYQELLDTVEGYIQQISQDFDPGDLTPQQRAKLEQVLQAYLHVNPPFSDEQLVGLLGRFQTEYIFLELYRQNMILLHNQRFHFKNYYHPFICFFTRMVYNPLKGIPALLSRETQLKNSGFSFSGTYRPTTLVVKSGTEDYYPAEVVDFSPDGSYSPYNWEMFFHIPLMIATRLSKNQRFEEAMEWFHYIFNPIGVESTLPDGTPAVAPQKYWITRPFFETADETYRMQRIDSILRMLAGDTTVDGFTTGLKKGLEDQVRDWRDNPFEPHCIARYRTLAYQKTTVMKYLDNLISWGDYLFRQDSMESINEATQLYILAAEILGPHPKQIPPRSKTPVMNFIELEDDLDSFSNALVQVENLVPVLPGRGLQRGITPPLPMLYFCIPQNKKLLEYWDILSDRLYKIRHCMNIEGVARHLPLFEPPIDPGALVKAVASGVDISSILADLNAPLPYYRFNIILHKANELCGDVRVLGNSLLAALEKKDAEELNLLRQSQEIKLLEAVRDIREKQIQEAKLACEGLKKTKDVILERRNYYRHIKKHSPGEIIAMTMHTAGIASEIGATVLNATAGTSHLVPKTIIGVSGFGGTPHVTIEYGGENVGKSSFNWAIFFRGLGGILHSGGNLASTAAGYERRWDDWKLQERIADKELKQIDKQIAAAELRIAVAEKELDNHILRIEDARATDKFLKSKYTGMELYHWMVGEISRVYFQSYQLAYDMAKRAERCYRFELGIRDSGYIKFGYWDSLKKGLLAGEKLQHDLRHLEGSYMEQNRREFELTKHISLAMLNPMALLRLKETGHCFFSLPEELFDLDYPGHYFRRIKSVSITIPCVAGPYTTVSCTLRLLKNHIRINTITDAEYEYEHNNEEGVWIEDERFVENNIPVKTVALSSAQNDSGVFELNFRDERYFPFEGAGVVSEWALELFHDRPSNNHDPSNPDFGKDLRQLDYNTINDVVIHLKYTAREDMGILKNKAIEHLRSYLVEDGMAGFRMFRMRHEFPDEWHRFINPQNEAEGNVMEFELKKNHFPFKDSRQTLRINSMIIAARCTGDGDYEVTFSPPLPEPPPDDINKMTLENNKDYADYGNIHHAKIDTSDTSKFNILLDFEKLNRWKIKICSTPTGNNLLPDEMEDMFLVLAYTWE